MKLNIAINEPPTLKFIDESKQAYVIVNFPPQHISEQAFFVNDDKHFPLLPSQMSDPITSNVDSRISGSSRLVFQIPYGSEPIPYNLSSLLDWSKFEPSVSPSALSPTRPLEPPEQIHSAIEAPYRLILSPNKYGGWAHSSTVVSQKNGQVELWHTRLGVKMTRGLIDEKQEKHRTIRAIWSKDYNPDACPEHLDIPLPFRSSLDERDRCELVSLTAYTSPDWESRVIKVNQLMLSSLGSWMNLRYTANMPADNSKLTIEEWKHHATMGRDQYVRVVYKGYLLPFGHRASLVKVTERKFIKNKSGGSTAYLFQRMYIIVRQPEKQYPEFGHNHNGRKMPFKRITITTLITPDLDSPTTPASSINDELGKPLGQSAFWPRVLSTTRDFLFAVKCEDSDGQQIEFILPLIFVNDEVGHNETKMEIVIKNYNSNSNASRRKCNTSGQKIAFAESSKKSLGDTTYETATITFDVEKPYPIPDVNKFAKLDIPLCYPSISQAEVSISAARQIAGQNLTAKIEFHPSYYADEKGFEGTNNKGEVFAKLVDDSPPLALYFKSSNSGGIVTPNFNIVGLSRRFGPIGGGKPTIDITTKFAEGKFDPIDFFSGTKAKLLGGIDLFSIIPSGSGLNNGNNIPSLTTKLMYPVAETKFAWKPYPLEAKGAFKPHTNPASTLDVECKITSNLDNSAEPTFKISGNLTNFDIDLFGFIIISMDEIKFEASTGKKMDITPIISEVKFGGPLKFVNELQKYLSIGGKGGFSVDTTTAGVNANFNLAIPTIGVGVVTIQNIAFNAGLDLPFNGDAVRFRFAFCEREHPFLLTIYGLGGGGFFGLSLGIDGVEILEAALEFGASVALDIGVASGEVHILAGIYYKWLQDKEGKEGVALLTGFLRMGGEVEVLGIISISVEFYMSLAFESGEPDSKVWGEAALTVKIHVAFFSKSVTMKVRREFADPYRITFSQLMTEEEWGSYCDAFAPITP